MTNKKTIAAHVENARAALTATDRNLAAPPDDVLADIGDLIADLMHLADTVKPESGEWVAEQATFNYTEDVTEAIADEQAQLELAEAA